jgi:hypothetical protein
MGRGDGMTAIVQYPGRSFTKVQAVSEPTFLVSQISPQRCGFPTVPNLSDFEPRRCRPQTPGQIGREFL